MSVLSTEYLEEYFEKEDFEKKLKEFVLQERNSYIKKYIKDNKCVAYDGIWNEIMNKIEEISANQQ